MFGNAPKEFFNSQNIRKLMPNLMKIVGREYEKFVERIIRI